MYVYLEQKQNSLGLGGDICIVHPKSFRSNAQNAIAFARRNCPRVKRNDDFAYVYLRLRAFAFVCEYCSQSTACAYVRAHARTYVYIYIHS